MKRIYLLAAAAMFAWSAQAQWTDLTQEGWNPDRGDFAAGDIDGDGDMDVIFSATDQDKAGVENGAIWINDGQGNFTVQEGERVIKMGRSGNIEFGDIDGDGDLDVIFGGWHNGSSTTVRGIALNDGNGVYTLADRADYPMTEVEKVTSCGFADFNGDGLLDYYVFANYSNHEGNSWQTNNYIYQQNADGTFTEKDAIPAAAKRRFNESSVVVFDFNRDGAPDLWFNTNDEAVGEGNPIRQNLLYVNDGSGNFTEYNYGDAIAHNKSNGTSSWADVDGDGFLDLLLNGDGTLNTGENSNAMWRFFKNGNGQSLSLAFDFGGKPLERQGSMSNGSYIVDWDGDGVMDLITAGWSDERKSQVLDLWKGNAKDMMSGFAMTTFGTGVPGFSEQGLRIADLDGDGKPDLLANGFSNTGEGRKVGWIKNASAQAGELPGAPQNATAAYDAEGDFVTFTWSAPAGWEGKPGVTYNLSLYNKTTGKWMYNPMSEENGKRKVGGRMGNVWTNVEYYLFDLPDGEYEWQVQAINGQYMGGAFTAKQTFSVGVSGVEIVNNYNPAVYVNANQLKVIGVQDAAQTVNIYSLSGALVNTASFNGTISMNMPQAGVYMVEVLNADGGRFHTKVVVK